MTVWLAPGPTRPASSSSAAGYVGMYAALRLQSKLSRGEASITVVDPQPHMTVCREHGKGKPM